MTDVGATDVGATEILEGDTIVRAPRAATSAPRAGRHGDRIDDVVAPPPPPSLVPSGYRFRVNDGRVLDLAGPVILGRRPSLPRIVRGPVPDLVRVDSPTGEVSSTHVELRQQGSTVIVTDLRSTNGTVVTVPGMAPQTLRQGESLVAVPGTLVDIGDGNRVEILPVGRLTPTDFDPLERLSP